MEGIFTPRLGVPLKIFMKKCRACGDELTKKNWYTSSQRKHIYTCNICHNQKQKDNYKECRSLVFDHYGRICKCCPIGDVLPEEFLTIDHVNNDGNLQRRDRKAGSIVNLIGKQNIRDGNFPKDLQTLCWNCNCAKGVSGMCPHQVEKTTPQLYT